MTWTPQDPATPRLPEDQPLSHDEERWLLWLGICERDAVLWYIHTHEPCTEHGLGSTVQRQQAADYWRLHHERTRLEARLHALDPGWHLAAHARYYDVVVAEGFPPVLRNLHPARRGGVRLHVTEDEDTLP